MNKDISNFSQSISRKELDLCEKQWNSTINIDELFSPLKKQSIDSGISSPTFLVNDNLPSKQKIEEKLNIVIDALGYQCQSNNDNSQQQVEVSSSTTSEPNQSGIGGIVSRIRSLSIGMCPRSYTRPRRQSDYGSSQLSYSVSPLLLSPDCDPESVKVSNVQADNIQNYIYKNLRPNRKWMPMSHCVSDDVDSFNFNEFPQKKNRLEVLLSGHIDTSTPNGALLAVINQGLRKVSESDRYLLFSKCPLRSPMDFLDSGMEHLGDSDILITVLHHSTCYDLMPDNGKLIVLDSAISLNKAFVAIENNSIDNAPVWHSQDQSFIGMLSKDNQMYLLLLAYKFREISSDNDTYMETISRESLLNCIKQEPSRHQLQLVNPEDTICSVIKHLDVTSSTQVLVMDCARSGNALYVLGHRRILSFLLSASQCGLPLPSVLKNTVGVTELMMSKTLLDRYKVYPSTTLATLLMVMDNNSHHCAIVCRKKPVCKRCLCTDEYIGLLTVDHISQLISQSAHCDPSYKVESILMQIPQSRNCIMFCNEMASVINVIKNIIEKKIPFILINQDCCKCCIHSIISPLELLNYIMKHDRYTAVRENTYVPEYRKSSRSFSCCETIQKISDKTIFQLSLDEKEEDVLNMDVT